MKLASEHTAGEFEIKSNLFCHKFSTQYNNEFALRLAGQTGNNFALMSAHDLTLKACTVWLLAFFEGSSYCFRVHVC